MVSMREIRRRRAAIEKTEQITRAMKLIATARLQKARVRLSEAEAYHERLYDVVHSIVRRSGEIRHPFISGNGADKKAVIAVTSNRGLAGGYNHNLIRLIVRTEEVSPEQTVIFAIGQKGRDGLAACGYPIAGEFPEGAGDVDPKTVSSIMDRVLGQYNEGKFGEVFLAYTEFKNTVTQTPVIKRILPCSDAKEAPERPAGRNMAFMNYEPDPVAVLDVLIPQYAAGVLYGALLHAAASENGARMTAMDSAASNAQELIEELDTAYNRARQDSITQELTEIIGGAGAIS